MNTPILPLFLVFVFTLPLPAASAPDGKFIDLATRGMIYGYPLLMMDATMRKMTAPRTPGGESVVNRFSHIREFPDHTFTDVVSPNADTLYSIAWLDLKTTPMVLSLPDTGDRYYVMQFLDAWTNDFISLGSRTTGNGPGKYLITGPEWKGEVPREMIQVKAPTNMVWILGRTQTNGKDDYEAVHAIQDRYTLHPFADAPAALVPPAMDVLSPLEKVESMDAEAFFAELNRLITQNPPASADAPLLAELAALSIGPGLDFDMDAMSENVATAIENGHSRGLAILAGLKSRDFGTVSNGWGVSPPTIGDYGTEYLFRAFIARFALGANLPEDAIYPTIDVDSEGLPLNGQNGYAIRFDPGTLPPVNAFWSISMYNDRQRFVENPIGRYAIGDRDPLEYGTDGGLTIYVQHDIPDAKNRTNWLPAPAGEFNMIMRLYWPGPSILDGSWPLPRLEKLQK